MPVVIEDRATFGHLDGVSQIAGFDDAKAAYDLLAFCIGAVDEVFFLSAENGAFGSQPVPIVNISTGMRQLLCPGFPILHGGLHLFGSGGIEIHSAPEQ
jgi:hypothetical protein